MRAFVQHYLEMVVAMFAGMFAYGQAARLWAPPGSAVADSRDMAMGAVATGALWDDISGLAQMELSMIVPMVLWMRFRGHSWRHGAEMSLAMVLPTIPVYAAGFIWPDLPMVGLLAHVAMLLGMLALMVAQRDATAGHAHSGGMHGTGGLAPHAR